MKKHPISRDDKPFSDLSSFMIFNVKRLSKEQGLKLIKDRIFGNQQIQATFKRTLIGDFWVDSEFDYSKQIEVIERMTEEDFVGKLISLNGNLDKLFNQTEHPQWKMVFCPDYKSDLSMFILVALHSYSDGIGLIKLLVQISDEFTEDRILENKVFSFSGQKLLSRYSRQTLRIPRPLEHDKFYALLDSHGYKRSKASYYPRNPRLLIKRIRFDSAMEQRLNAQLGISFLNLQSAFVYLICKLSAGRRFNSVYTNISLRGIDYRSFTYGNFLSRVIVSMDSAEEDLIELARIHKAKFVAQIKENVHVHFYNEFLDKDTSRYSEYVAPDGISIHMDSLNELSLLGSKVLEAFQFGGFYSRVLDIATFGIGGYKNMMLAFEDCNESLRSLIENKFALIEQICQRFEERPRF